MVIACLLIKLSTYCISNVRLKVIKKLSIYTSFWEDINEVKSVNLDFKIEKKEKHKIFYIPSLKFDTILP
jgi:hypothetical protein